MESLNRHLSYKFHKFGPQFESYYQHYENNFGKQIYRYFCKIKYNCFHDFRKILIFKVIDNTWSYVEYTDHNNFLQCTDRGQELN